MCISQYFFLAGHSNVNAADAMHKSVQINVIKCCCILPECLCNPPSRLCDVFWSNNEHSLEWPCNFRDSSKIT